MFDTMRTRALYESYVRDPKRPGGKGRSAFVNTFRHWLGLCDEKGNNYRDHVGNRVMRNPKITAEEISLQETAQAIIGPDYRTYFDPSNRNSLAGFVQFRNMTERMHPGDGTALLEAVGVGVDVSSFANINAWTAVNGGLVERKILEAFENPAFIGDELMPSEPTKVAEGQKVIGAAKIGDKGEERQPGQPHKRAGFGERYVTLPKTRENALAIDLEKEAVFFDLTGQVLERASAVGEELAYRRELDIIDAFIGVTSQSAGKYQFVYKGTATNTYQTTNANTFGYINDQSNELLDWTNYEASWLLFQRMTDAETGKRILSMPDTVLVNPGKMATAEQIWGASGADRRHGDGTQATSATLHVTVDAENPAKKFGVKKILWSPLVEQRCTDSDGLALSQSAATKYWWHFQKGKAFKYMVNWPLNIQQAPANSYEMLDRGIVSSYFANERGCPSVWSPWNIVRNKS